MKATIRFTVDVEVDVYDEDELNRLYDEIHLVAYDGKKELNQVKYIDQEVVEGPDWEAIKEEDQKSLDDDRKCEELMEEMRHELHEQKKEDAFIDSFEKENK